MTGKRTLAVIATIMMIWTEAAAQYTMCTESDSFAVRKPLFSKIELAVENAPDTASKKVVMCAPAAFTGLIRPGFDHINIAGWHVAGDSLHKGFPCRNNTGGMICRKDGKIEFHDKTSYDSIVAADSDIHTAICQCMVILNGKEQEKFPREEDWVASYRVLCERKGELFLFETRCAMTRRRFMEELRKLDVDNAMYMEMGQDYNHTWWRNQDGKATVQYEKVNGSNWIVFEKE